MIKYIHEKYSKNESIRKKYWKGSRTRLEGKTRAKDNVGF